MKMVFVYSYDPAPKTKSNPFRLRAAEGDSWEVPKPPYFLNGRFMSPRSERTLEERLPLKLVKHSGWIQKEWEDDDFTTVLAPGLGSVEEGGSGFYVALRRAVINGKEYKFRKEG